MGAVVGWLVLTALNTADLILYRESLNWSDVNEMWILSFMSPDELTMIKLFMPVFVAGILYLNASRRMVKTLWYMCALYTVVLFWNILQFIL